MTHQQNFLLRDRATRQFVLVGRADPFSVDIDNPSIIYGLFQTSLASLSPEDERVVSSLMDLFFQNGFVLNNFSKFHDEVTVSDYYVDDRTYSLRSYYYSEIDIMDLDRIKDSRLKNSIEQPVIVLCSFDELKSEIGEDEMIASLLVREESFLS